VRMRSSIHGKSNGRTGDWEASTVRNHDKSPGGCMEFISARTSKKREWHTAREERNKAIAMSRHPNSVHKYSVHVCHRLKHDRREAH
jgi:hypothetical protein